jgi:hypothetical protein
MKVGRRATLRRDILANDRRHMAAENLSDIIGSLTPDEQESVRQFVEFLKRKTSSSSSPFLSAAEEFMDQHPELLRRLAQ